MNMMRIRSKYRVYSIAPITHEDVKQLQNMLEPFFDNGSISYFFYVLGRRLGVKILQEKRVKKYRPSPTEFLSIVIPLVRVQVEEQILEKKYLYNFAILDNEGNVLHGFPLCCLIRGLLESYVSGIRRNILHAYQCILIQNGYYCSHRFETGIEKENLSLDGGCR